MEVMKILNYIIPILIVVFCSVLYSYFDKNVKVDLKNFSKSIYDYELTSIDGEKVSLKEFKGKKMLVVNVASKCGYTYQYSDLQKLHEKYKDDLVVLGFPANDFLWQEPAKNSQIKTFCSTKYGVTFPMFEKSVVKKKENQNPLYVWLSNKDLNGWNDSAPSWNFCKYLIDDEGKLIEFFSQSVNPLDEKITNYFDKK